jgi:heterotetrameric sarcosine oxidase alpha subunit/heterotetrameric sarcosine oxidase gamma subunit
VNAEPFRLPAGGAIDRARTLAFTFDGRAYAGRPGDTLASALLANGVRIVGRSFKYHRPRGVFTAGAEEPNALVRIGEGDRAEPNTRATMVELYDGLVAHGQNCWPSLGFDVWALNNLFAPLFPAGFYYKTFMAPAAAWPTYERLIRRAAGMGTHVPHPDPDHYDRRFAHCDVLMVGGGAAGLMAATAAARAGADVMLADERDGWGGHLRGERAPGADVLLPYVRELSALSNVRLLSRTTAFGVYDHGTVALAERVADHLGPSAAASLPRQRLWMVRAREIVIATGAIERPLVFAGNDRPGVMLAAAARAYINRFAVAPGRRAVVLTNNSDAYRTALDAAAAGVQVAAVVDARPAPTGALVAAARDCGIEVRAGHAVVATRGSRALRAVAVAPIDADGRPVGAVTWIDCDLLAVSGGLTPSVHLHSQTGGKLAWDETIAAFVPAAAPQRTRACGAARGVFGLADCLADGARAGMAAAEAIGLRAPALDLPACPPDELWSIRPLWEVKPAGKARGKRFVDLQDDVTADDLDLAVRENYRAIEHVKRYTTLGMGTDQGKTSNLNGLAIVAARRAEAIAAVGTTTFRPPYTPVTFGTLAGPETGKHFEPIRRTPLHDWHAAHGARFVEAGQWLRPRAYLHASESFGAAWRREVLAVRGAAGLCDVSTLGKIDVQGLDATAFLERVYCNGFARLAVGRCRYGLMLREDGISLDDGTATRIGERHYLLTTTTANAGKVLAHLEYLLQTVWPALNVRVASVTDQYGQIALAGPRSRDVLRRVIDTDVDNAALPFLGSATGTIAGARVRLFRISYSGELAYEIAVAADHTVAAWEALHAAGRAFGLVPYGTEAMAALRIEKGHVAGAEINGQTTPADLGLARLVSAKKHFVGRRLLERPALADAARPRLVGLEPVDGVTPIPAGAQLVENPHARQPVPMLGHVTSTTFSPTLDRPIALALITHGTARKGETVMAAAPLEGSAVAARVVDPVFYDPAGERLRALEHDLVRKPVPTPDQVRGRLFRDHALVAEAPARRSPLPPGFANRAPGASLHVCARGPLDIVQVAALGAAAETAERLSKHFALAIAVAPNRAVMAGDLTVLWHGPGQWLIVRAPGAAPLADELAGICGEAAAVVDLGHARAALRFEGEGVRDVLAKGTSIDLRPARFAPGACALTALGKIGALLHAATPATVDVYVARSYAQALVEWLEHAARDVAVEFNGVAD